MKERCHKQSRLTVPALCQSQSAASAASLNFNKLNLFSKRPCEQLYNKIVKKLDFDAPIQLPYNKRRRNKRKVF